MNKTRNQWAKQGLGLCPSESLPKNQLPLVKDVLNRYLFIIECKKNSTKCKRYLKPADLVGCTSKTKSTSLTCGSGDSCNKNEMCLVAEIVTIWQIAGLPHMTPQTIKKKILKVISDYTLNEKRIRSLSVGDVTLELKKEKYVETLNGLFEIGSLNLEQLISCKSR